MTEVSTQSPSSPGRNNHHAPAPLLCPISQSDSQSEPHMAADVLHGGHAAVGPPLPQAGVTVPPAASLEGERQLPAHGSTSAGAAGADGTPALSLAAKCAGSLALEGMSVPSPVGGQDSLEGGTAGLPTSPEVQQETGPEEPKESLTANSGSTPNLPLHTAVNQNQCPVIRPKPPYLPPEPTSLPFSSSDGNPTVTAVPTKHVSTTLEITITGSVTTAPKPQEPAPQGPPQQRVPPQVVSPKKPQSPSTPRAVHFPTIPVLQEPTPSLLLQNSHQEAASDTLSYLESASLMSGTLESLSGLGEDGSSLGSDSEVNGLVFRRTDKYGFLGGAQYSEASGRDVRGDVVRLREMKWLEMFSNWEKWVYQRFQKVKLRCRKGIPSSLRAKAWQLLSNSKELMDSNPGRFEVLEREQGDPKWLDMIEKDLHRQFPFHEMFAARGGHGQQDLYRILKAYTVYRPEEGYCQAQAPVAAVLLMHMPAEHAFWCLVQICDVYLPGYYSAGLEAIQLDGDIFFSLLRRFCPMAYRHLKRFKIDPILYMTEWFMCIFSRSLPWACVLRVWDMFFCEGVKIVFRVGLVLLKQMLGSVEKLRELQGMYETMERLRNISQENLREELLVQEVVSLPVTDALIERQCSIQVSRWRESRGELSHNPSRRLHGARAIYELKRRAAFAPRRGSFSFLGGSAPYPGPLRASSSLLSLPAFRRSKGSFQFTLKKGSVPGASAWESAPVASFPGQIPRQAASCTPSSRPAAQGQLQAHCTVSGQSDSAAALSPLPTQEPLGAAAHREALASAPSHTLPPAPKTVPKAPAPSVLSLGAGRTLPQPAEPAGSKAQGREEAKRKKKSKEEKKREEDEEKQRARGQKEREKVEKVKQKKEKEMAEKERRKDRGGM